MGDHAGSMPAPTRYCNFHDIIIPVALLVKVGQLYEKSSFTNIVKFLSVIVKRKP